MPKLTIVKSPPGAPRKYPPPNIRVGEVFHCDALTTEHHPGPFMRVYAGDTTYRAVCLSSGDTWDWGRREQEDFFKFADFIPVTATLTIDKIGDN